MLHGTPRLPQGCGQALALPTCGIHEGSLRTAITLGLPTTTSHRAISRVVRHSSSHCCNGSPQVIKLCLLLQDFGGYSLISDQAFRYCSIQLAGCVVAKTDILCYYCSSCQPFQIAKAKVPFCSHDLCRCVFLNIPDDTFQAGFSMPTHYPARMHVTVFSSDKNIQPLYHSKSDEI